MLDDGLSTGMNLVFRKELGRRDKALKINLKGLREGDAF